MKEFPLTLREIQKNEASQWAIGDALLKETGGDKSQVAKAADYLFKNGLEYSPKYLTDLLEISKRFPLSRRRDGIAYEVHRRAGTPEMLESFVSVAKKGEKITRVALDDFKGRVRKAQEEERKEAHQAAKKEEASAKEAEKKAVTLMKEAETEAEKKAAEKIYFKAEEAVATAVKKIKETKVPPKRGVHKPPPRGQAQAIVESREFLADLEGAILMVKKISKSLEKVRAELSDKTIDAINETAMELANEAQRLAAQARVAHKRGEHLSVVA